MAAGGRKTLRERVTDDMVAIPTEGMSQRWSDWKPVMGPQRSDHLTESRRGSGYTTSNLSGLGITDECGIYEFGIEVRYGIIVYAVYLGSTCRCDRQCLNERNTNCGLRTRIFEYCQGGSHKRILFNQAIDHGMTIYVRTRKVNDEVNGWRNKERAARAAENYLLEKYDYAWNIRQNNKQTARSVEGIRPPKNILHHPCPFCIKCLETRPRTA